MKGKVPSAERFIEPTFEVIRHLGGSGTIEEINQKTFEVMSLTEEQLAVPHKGNRTKAEYRMAWARTYLKGYGVIDNSERGVWSLTTLGNEMSNVKAAEVVRIARAKTNEVADPDTNTDTSIKATSLEADLQNEEAWRQDLLDVLQSLTPDSFERFCQRVLRESGFIHVNVTGRSGDGGIDGNGIIRIASLISYPIIFQCKRYKGAVTASQVRDFRGAMIGRADKGLIITTGTFTRDALKEATRDGAPVIDLVDGERLVQTIHDLELGIKVRMIEEVTVDREWFKTSF